MQCDWVFVAETAAQATAFLHGQIQEAVWPCAKIGGPSKLTHTHTHTHTHTFGVRPRSEPSRIPPQDFDV